jgi:hypothetical protein
VDEAWSRGATAQEPRQHEGPWYRATARAEQPEQAARERRDVTDPAEAAMRGWVTIRHNALTRVRRMAHGHVRLAVNPPRGRIPGPHALAYLYAWHSPTSTQQWPIFDVAAATRLVDDTEDTQPGHNVRDLPALLYGLWEVVRDRVADGGFDPRLSMADRSDDMGRDATFVGIAISSLGDPRLPWDQSLARAKTALLAEMNMPMAWRIRLTDGTRIEVDRPPGAQSEFVRSSERLDPPGAGYLGRWQRLDAIYQPQPGSVDHALDVLCIAVADGIRDRSHGRRR